MTGQGSGQPEGTQVRILGTSNSRSETGTPVPSPLLSVDVQSPFTDVAVRFEPVNVQTVLSPESHEQTLLLDSGLARPLESASKVRQTLGCTSAHPNTEYRCNGPSVLGKDKSRRGFTRRGRRVTPPKWNRMSIHLPVTRPSGTCDGSTRTQSKSQSSRTVEVLRVWVLTGGRRPVLLPFSTRRAGRRRLFGRTQLFLSERDVTHCDL